MKTKSYTRAEAMRLIPLLEGIALEIIERRNAIRETEEMIRALSVSHRVHLDEIQRKRAQLSRQRIELRRVGQELEELGCGLALTDPFEIFVPGVEEGFGWRPGETFLRRALISPYAAELRDQASPAPCPRPGRGAAPLAAPSSGLPSPRSGGHSSWGQRAWVDLSGGGHRGAPHRMSTLGERRPPSGGTAGHPPSTAPHLAQLRASHLTSDRLRTYSLAEPRAWRTRSANESGAPTPPELRPQIGTQ